MSGANPYCVDNRHALYVGWMMGLLMRHGFHTDFVDDENGVHTNAIRLMFDGIAFELIVPPPPPEWRLDWIPVP